MANASKKHVRDGRAGQRDPVRGGMTEIDKDKIGENMVLSNRDKAGHSPERGLDSKAIENEQYQDQNSNKVRE